MRLREAAPLLVDVGTADGDVSKAPLDNDSKKNTNTAKVRDMMQTRRKTYLEAAATAGVKRRRRQRRRRK